MILRRLLLNKKKCGCYYIKQCSYFNTSPGPSPINFDEEAAKRRRKASAMKKLNWENLELFGPLLHRKETGSRLRKVNLNIFNSSRRKENSHEKVRQLLLRTISLDGMLPNVNSSYANSSDGIFSCEFPFHGAVHVSVNELNERIAKVIQTNGQFLAQTEKLPSVTSILQKSISAEEKNNLDHRRLEVINDVGILTYFDYVKEMQEIQLSLISGIVEYFNGNSMKENHLNPNATGYWNSLLSLLSEITDVTLQRRIEHPHLCYTGLVDCIARFRDRRILFEWILPYEQLPFGQSVWESPLRAAAYVGALNAIEPDDAQISEVCLVVMHPTEPATLMHIELGMCLQLWSSWLDRLSKYWKLRSHLPGNLYINVSVK